MSSQFTPPDQSAKLLTTPVHCAISGVVLGTLQVNLVEGAIPFAQDFQQVKLIHPFFAQSDYNLLKKFAESVQWFNDMEWHDSPAHAHRLQVICCVAIHKLNALKLESPSIPPWPIVAGSAARILHLSKWYLLQTSKRTQLPTFSISRANDNLGWQNLRFWLDEVTEIKTRWERKTREIERDVELRSREAALQTLKSAHYTRIDNKKVWNWIAIQLDTNIPLGRIATFKQIFMSGDLEPELWLTEDVDDMIEAVTEYCDIGNEIMYYINQRLHGISKCIEDFNGSFTVVSRAVGNTAAVSEQEKKAEDNFFASFDKQVELMDAPPAEPQRRNFATDGHFIKAQAQWRILKGRYELMVKRRNAGNASSK